LCLALVVFQFGKAAADTFSFDPAACHPEAGGLVHIALGTSVFRWPERELTLIDDSRRDADGEALAAPDPTEPEGCPKNPIRGSNFSFAYRYQAILEDKSRPVVPEFAPDLLQLIRLGKNAAFQLGGRADYENLCSHSNMPHQMIHGMTECSIRPNDPKIPERLWARSYQAPPATYAAPFGETFYVNCVGGNALECTVRYKMRADVMVLYKFRPERIPLDHIFDFDRALRAKISGAEVPEYPWIRNAPTGSTPLPE
jgi:hypothetical protein